VASVAGKVAEMITLLLLVSVVPRSLGPENYGVFALALAIVTIGSSSFALGGPSLMGRFIPAAVAEERAALARALALRAIRWRVLQMLVLAVAATILAFAQPLRFPALESALVVFAVGCDVAATLAFQIGLGFGRTGAWSFRYPAQNSVLIVSAVILGRTAGATGAVAAVAIASGAALALGLFGLGPLRGAPRATLPPGVTRFALLNGASGLLIQLVHRGGVVAVKLLTGSTVQAGFAALAGGVGLAATYLVWQNFTVELPRLSALAALDPEGVNAATRRLARNTALLLVPAALAAVFVVEHGIPLVAGDRFRGALSAFGPALALLPLAPLTALGNQASALRLRPEERFKSTVVGAVTFVAVAAALVPTHGALGATSALLAGTAATSLWLAVAFPDLFSRRSLGWALGGVVSVLVLAAVT